MLLDHVARTAHPVTDDLFRCPVAEVLRDRTAPHTVRRPRRRAVAQMLALPELAGGRILVVRTVAPPTRLRPPIGRQANRRLRQTPLRAREQRPAAVLVGHVRAVVLDVVLEDADVVLAERDRTLRRRPVLQRRPLIRPVADIETALGRVEIVNIERPERAEADSGVPEDREDRVLTTGVSELLQVLQHLLGVRFLQLLVARQLLGAQLRDPNALAKALLNGVDARTKLEEDSERGKDALQRDLRDLVVVVALAVLPPDTELVDRPTGHVVHVLDGLLVTEREPRVQPVAMVLKALL